MSRSLSLYLDLLRFVAAFAVYLFHAKYFAKAKFPLIGNLGGEAVIVFFVLSGLVITAAKKQSNMSAFVQARLVRLWSVCLPALCLTLILDIVGQYISAASYHPMQAYSPFKWAASIGINALFLNQIWSFNIYPGTNGPFWSLSYEFWYYMMFGACVYLQGLKKLAALAAAILIVGPSILMAFPVWLLGTAVYMALSRRLVIRASYGWALWLGSFVAIFVFAYAGLHQMFKELFPGIAAEARWGVDFWPSSYLIGMIVAANILGFAVIGRFFSASLERISSLIRLGAKISFGLYLFHYPLMYFSKAVLNASGIASGPYFVTFIYMTPFVLAAAMAFHCENYKSVFARAIEKTVSLTLGRFSRSKSEEPRVPSLNAQE